MTCLVCEQELPEAGAIRSADRQGVVPGSFEVRVCPACGGGTTLPPGRQRASWRAYYAAEYGPHERSGASGPLARATMAARLRTRLFRRLDAVSPNGGGARSLLDVGAGSGDLGGVFGAHGWEVVGVEPSAAGLRARPRARAGRPAGNSGDGRPSGRELRRGRLPPQPRARRRPAGGPRRGPPAAEARRGGRDRRAQLRLAAAAPARGRLVGARRAAPPLPLHPRGAAQGARRGGLRARLAAAHRQRAGARRQRPAAPGRADGDVRARPSWPATGWRWPPTRRSGRCPRRAARASSSARSGYADDDGCCHRRPDGAAGHPQLPAAPLPGQPQAVRPGQVPAAPGLPGDRAHLGRLG